MTTTANPTPTSSVPASNGAYRDYPTAASLASGDRMSADEFDRIYEQLPGVCAELIKGVVYVASPVYVDHGDPDFRLTALLGRYVDETPGVVGSSNLSMYLPGDNRPQPDLILRVDPAMGGLSRIENDKKLIGPVEFICEIAVTSVRYDLGEKLNVYREFGVQEYVVWRVADGTIDWFVLDGKEYRSLDVAESVCRSTVLPGLWLDLKALVEGNRSATIAALARGLASPEHAAFVKRLAEYQAPK